MDPTLPFEMESFEFEEGYLPKRRPARAPVRAGRPIAGKAPTPGRAGLRRPMGKPGKPAARKPGRTVPGRPQGGFRTTTPPSPPGQARRRGPATMAAPRRQGSPPMSPATPDMGSTFPSSVRRRPPGYYPRPRWRPTAVPFSYRPDDGVDTGPPSSDFVRSMQECLREMLGWPVPVTGFIGPATRRAIRSFQQSEGLPVTGTLDSATHEAIQAKCGEQAPGAPPEAPAQTAEPADNSGAEPPESSAEPQEELRVDSPCSIKVNLIDKRLPLTDMKAIREQASAPGIYIIYVDKVPWYVGKAERGIYNRFLERRKALNDFGLDANKLLAGRYLSWIPITASSFVGCQVSRGEEGKTFTRLGTMDGVLRVLEQRYIRNLGTYKKGNSSREEIRIMSGASLRTL